MDNDATVGVFGYWYTAYDWSEYGHPLISVSHLSNWGKCSHFGEMAEFTSDPCAPHLPPADAPRARRLLTAAAVYALWIDRVVRLLDASARFSDGAICIGSNGAMRAAVAASRAARLLIWLASSRQPTTATVSTPDDDRGTGLLIAEDHPNWLAVVLRRGGLEAVARNLLAAEARASRMRQGREKKQWAGMRSHQCAPLALRNALTLLVRREEMGLSVGGTKGITCVVARACAASKRAREFSRGCWWHVADEVRVDAACDIGELCRNGRLSSRVSQT